MARIRTVKPEFWTDSVMVQLPFEARLLFIGIWNFCDDQGYLVNEPERLRMQVFPSEPSLDLASLLDLLVAAERLEMFTATDGEPLLRVKNFEKHQKVDNPSRPRFAGAKKRAIPLAVRREVATKYGCEPGQSKEANCYYCGASGSIHWWQLSSGKPSGWVSFSLELDHLEPELTGGPSNCQNLVLACGACNRSKHTKEFTQMWPSLAKASEPSPPEGKGREGKGSLKALSGSGPTTDCNLVFEYWRKVMHKPAAKLTPERERKVRARLKDYPLERIRQAIDGCKRSPYHQGQNETGTKYEDLELICRDGKHIEMFEGFCSPRQTGPPPPKPKTDADVLAEVTAEFEAKNGRVSEGT